MISFKNPRALRQIVQKRGMFGLPDPAMKGKDLVEFEQQKINHAAKSAKMWKNIFYFTGVPLIIASGFNAYMIEKAHFEHLEHHPPHYKDLPHLHVRNKPFPWKDGKKSLFQDEKYQPSAPSE